MMGVVVGKIRTVDIKIVVVVVIVAVVVIKKGLPLRNSTLV